MARRNRVPESVSMETPKAKRAEKARRERIEAEQRERDTPSMSARDPRNTALPDWRGFRDQMREEVTPTDAAGRAYAASGNVPMAVAMGGLKTAETFGPAKATGQMGGGNPLKGVLPKHPGKNLGARGATAGYVAEKTGKSVSEVLTGHGRSKSSRDRAFRRRSAERDASLEQAEQMRTELRTLVDGSATSKDSPSKQMAKLVAKLSPYGLQAVRDGIGSFIANTDAGRRYAKGRLGQLQAVLAKMPRSVRQIEELHAGDPTVGIPRLLSVPPKERARIIDGITRTDGVSPASAYRAFLDTIGDALHYPQWNEAKGTSAKPKLGELIYPFMFGGTVGANVELPAGHPRSIERPVLPNLKNWFIDGIIAASVKRMGQDTPSTLKATVMDRSGNASKGLRSAVQSHALSEKELVDIASEKPWLVRDRIDSGNASPSMKRWLLESPDLAVRALASRFPGTTAEELRSLHETYHVPLSAIQKEFPWTARRDRTKGDAAVTGHLKFFADHLDSLREGPLKSLALNVVEPGKWKAAIVPRKTVNVYDTMPADDLESFVPPGHTPQEALEWMSKQTERRFTGLPDIRTLLKLAKRTDISAQERTDLIREADESLYEQFRAGKAGFTGTPAGLAVSMLDALNLREAWAARTPASGKRSPAAEENRRTVGELQAAGLDLREMNERWLDALSMGKYGAAAQNGAPWLVQRRRTLDNAVADFTAYPTPLSAASAAITLYTESPGRLGAGFDYSHDRTPHFRVNYLMRPGSMTLGPSIQGYWTDAGTGISGYVVPNAVQNRRAGYEALSRLKLLGARHGPNELSDRISGRLHRIPPTIWTGPSDSPTFPFSLAARYLGDRAGTLQVSGARRFKFGEINIEKDIPRESAKDYIGAIELVRRGRSGEPSADEYDYVQQLRDIAQDYGIDLIESKSDHFHPATADLALPTETEVHRDPQFHHQDAKGGDSPDGEEDRFATSRNFLATDKVPDSIFGYPIVSDRKDYTQEDLEFFRKHPDAGGYYDLGEGGQGDGAEGPAAEPRGDGLDELIAEEGEPEPDGLDGLMGDLEGGEAGETPLEAYPLEEAVRDEAAARDDAYVARLENAMAEAIPFIKEQEGFRDEAYQDSVGKWTIGYGQTRTLDPETGELRDVREGDRITEEAAEAFLAKNLREAVGVLHVQNPWLRDLSEETLPSVFDVAYNLGPYALSAAKSPNLNSGMAAASADARDDVWWREQPTYRRAGGHVSRGLVKRRSAARTKWRK